MYSNKDIYLLDDPISSLDANVGTKIMRECICGYLKGKTRILITNSLQCLSLVDRIIYMKNGYIEWDGNYFDLIKQEFYPTIQNQPTYIANPLCDINMSNTAEEYNYNNASENKAMQTQELVSNRNMDNSKPLHVSMSIYLKYIKFIGGTPLMIILVIIIIPYGKE